MFHTHTSLGFERSASTIRGVLRRLTIRHIGILPTTTTTALLSVRFISRNGTSQKQCALPPNLNLLFSPSFANPVSAQITTTNAQLPEWDRKATKAHERKLRAKAEASGTGTGGGGVTANAAGGGHKADALRKAVGVGSKPTDPAVCAEVEDNGSEKLQAEGESGEHGDEDEQEDENQDEGNKGKYSRRKIVDNSWRYDEPEEDPYLKGLIFPCVKPSCHSRANAILDK